ncbi:MAG: isochorismate synthase [Candidatus Binatia bacterium]
MPEVGALRSATSAVADPGDFLALARGWSDGPLFYWEHPASGRALVAIGVAREIHAHGPDRFTTVATAVRRILATVQPIDEGRRGLRMVGGFAFSERRLAGSPAFPAARWVLPRLAWWREGGRTWLTRIWDDDDASSCDELLARRDRTAMLPSRDLHLHASPITTPERAEWRARVDGVRRLIADGAVRKVVLARARQLAAPDSRAPVDPAVVLRAARDARPACFSLWVRGRDAASLIAATPELLVRRRGATVTASALAGTAPRADDRALDRRLGAELLTCPKNAREHAIVVTAIRDALGALADDVVASAKPELLVLPEAQHLATVVTGRLRGPSDVLEVAGTLHPTPAVCGAPRAAARALIETQEPERGWYTGAVGWMDDAGDGELAVVLRSALVTGRTVTLRAGAGIVEGSDADAELAETEAKMTALMAPFVAGQSGDAGRAVRGAAVGAAGAAS